MKKAVYLLLDIEAIGYFIFWVGFIFWARAQGNSDPIGNPPTFLVVMVLILAVVVGLANLVWISRRRRSKTIFTTH